MVPDPLLFTFALISSGALSFLLVYYVSLPKKKKQRKFVINKSRSHSLQPQIIILTFTLNIHRNSNNFRQLHFQTWNVTI